MVKDKVFYGIVAPRRMVFTADCTPTLENIEELIDADWGEHSSYYKRYHLADRILTAYCKRRDMEQIINFAEYCLKKIPKDKPWQVTKQLILRWITHPNYAPIKLLQSDTVQ